MEYEENDYTAFEIDDPVTSFLVEEQRQFAQLDETPPATEVESEQIKSWRIEFNNRIVEKDAKEAELVEALRVEANKVLCDWHKKKNDELASLKSKRIENLEADGQTKEIKNGQTCWDKVYQYCDSGNIVKGSGDCSRMKMVISSLRSNNTRTIKSTD